jgi:hypothetical protein
MRGWWAGGECWTRPPLYDAVATMGTVMLVRPAIRGLLKACGAGLTSGLRAVLRRDDDSVASRASSRTHPPSHTARRHQQGCRQPVREARSRPCRGLGSVAD